MKTKAKLILAMSVLTAGVVAAGATGTFAWFTTNRAAQLNYTSVTAMKNAGNLNVFMGVENSDGNGWGTTNEEAKVPLNGSMATASLPAASHMSDVSSQDGVSFYKPVWKTVSGTGAALDRIDPGARAVDYSVFYFKVVNMGTRSLEVYLNSSTSITGAPSEIPTETTANNAAAKYTRFAINPAAKNGENDYPVINLAVPGTGKTWTVENKTGESSDGLVLDNTKTTVATNKTIDATKVNLFELGGSPAIQAITSASKVEEQKLCTLAASETAYFHVSVWLEGTKSDAEEFQKAAGGKVNILLDLAGVEVA